MFNLVIGREVFILFLGSKACRLYLFKASLEITFQHLHELSLILDYREKFFNIIKEVTQNSFKLSIDKVLGHLSMSGKVIDDNIRSLFFGDYMNAEGEKIYDEVSDLKELTKVMEG